MEFALTVNGLALRVRSPDPALVMPVREALNASYREHAPFLEWALEQTSEERALASMLRAQDDFASETGERRLFIVTEDGQAVVGCIGLVPRRRKRYVVGYWANSAFAGKGYLREVLQQLVKRWPEFTFYLTTSSANTRSQRLAEAAGFTLIRIHSQARQSPQHGVQDTWVYRFGGKRQAKKSPRESAGEP
ncbi:GNAT family N-acetyltransferase [Pseudomonas sp. MG-9]|uniref:GNAT family N-acetyltransferase n=1 Tax=Pseudomonas sp. MG-9 TaxID=2839032 RepID=UPI001C00159E|nr:GNAT family N-acetyltransferase [Pseudomonas sp. MG-9]MBT9266846.1 GNAT family N-acetyltransferase [Pseudomonas sp. MG-9]